MSGDFPLQTMFDMAYLDSLDDESLTALHRYAWERSSNPDAPLYWFFKDVLYAMEHYPRRNPKAFEKKVNAPNV